MSGMFCLFQLNSKDLRVFKEAVYYHIRMDNFWNQIWMFDFIYNDKEFNQGSSPPTPHCLAANQ